MRMRWEETADLCRFLCSEDSSTAGSGGEQGNCTDAQPKGDSEPVGVFGPVMVFLACLLALGVSHLPFAQISA